MLRRLRFQLTFLYTFAALGLVGLIGFGSYMLLEYYFQQETDLALNYKMATQYRSYGITPPSTLIRAEQVWREANVPFVKPSPTLQPTMDLTRYFSEESEQEDDNPGENLTSTVPHKESESDPEDQYNAQLAPIYVLPLNAQGEIIQNPDQVAPSISQNEAAIQAALISGEDLRTITLPTGTRVRLLTYRISSATGPVLLQAGRTLADQDRILERYILGWLILGCVTSVFLGLGSWWLSGRSLGPLQKAWEQQQAFISNASHELRTPLTLIKASAEVGLRGQPGDEEKELLEDISAECDYMNRLVDDLLLLSRLDTHRLPLARELISLSDLVWETAHQAEKLAIEKGIKLEVGAASGMVWGDRMRIRQVLLILLDNAMRFTPRGGQIRLETSEKHRFYQINVTDNGSGISARDLPHVFERFYQANSPGDAQLRTNGLGLSIAKGVIEAQGGRIHIESWAGLGTRVVVELPAAQG